MAGNLTAMIAAIFSGSAVSTDPYFNYTTLLLSTTATNGQQNNTFQDSSTNNFTITRNPATGPNAPTQGTFSPFSQTGWGNYFDGTSDYLTVNDNAALELGSSNFCLEFMYYPTSSANTDFVTKRVNASSYGVIIVQTGLALNFWLSSSGSSWDLFSNAALGSVTLNAWNHLAIYRIGNAWYSSLNGTITTLSASLSGSVVNNAANWNIGGNNYTSGSVIGYLSNFRLVIGSSVYTSTSAPIPTAPLTAVTNTQLLTCQSNRFVDNSANNFAVTPTGNTTVVPFSPFNPTSAWSASTVGGSGYFDGTGDQLTESSSALFSMGTGQFTIEFWVYRTASAFQTLFTSNSGSTSIQMFTNTGNTAELWISASQLTSNFGSLALNSWNHVAIVRDGSSNMSAYVNGVRGYTAVRTDNLNNVGIQVGGRGSDYLSGYLSGFRWVSGAALYSGTSFTVPTSPPTATPSSGTTVLLLNFTNSGIYDATAKNVLETVGNAQVSTTQSKWSPTSMYFDGTGDYLPTNNFSNPLLSFGTGDFTIEYWAYASSGTNNGLFQLSDTAGGFKTSQANSLAMNIFTNNAVSIYANGTSYQAPNNTLPYNLWTHFAIVRSSNVTKLYANGSLITSIGSSGSITDNTNYTGTYIVVGGYYSTGYLFTGYIDDFRITRGYARYVTGTGSNANKMVFNGTNTLALPTAAFPVQ